MSEWWKTAKKILSGKPKGSKLIVLGVFLVGLGVVLPAIEIKEGLAFVALGSLAFGIGLSVYHEEAEYELEKKREKDAQKREQNKL